MGWSISQNPVLFSTLDRVVRSSSRHTYHGTQTSPSLAAQCSEPHSRTRRLSDQWVPLQPTDREIEPFLADGIHNSLVILELLYFVLPPAGLCHLATFFNEAMQSTYYVPFMCLCMFTVCVCSWSVYTHGLCMLMCLCMLMYMHCSSPIALCSACA